MELRIFLFPKRNLLDTPLVDAFRDLDEYEVDQFIVVVYDDDPDVSLTRSSKLIQKLGPVKIGESLRKY
jgi:hypothetical protein